MSWKNLIKNNNLDISVVRLSNLFGGVRLDSESYIPRFIEAEEKLENFDTNTIQEISQIITNGHTPLHADLNKGEINFLTAESINDFTIEYDSDKHIFEKPHKTELKRTILHKDDLLITIKGKVGNAVAVSIDPKEKFNINQDVARLVFNENINPYYISAFLNSKFGKTQTERMATGQINPFLGLNGLKQIKILFPEKKLQDLIKQVLIKSYELNFNSKSFYKEAEQIFLKEINLEEYKRSSENISVRNFVDCLIEDRFDAEYWQPKYDEMIKRVSSVTQKDLIDIVSVKKGVEVGSEAYSDKGKLFVRVSDFSIYGIDEGEKRISEELYEELKDKYKPQKGEILFTKDGTIGLSFALHEDLDVIVSGAFLRLKPKTKISNDYLALVLNSSYCKSQIERMSGGAIIAHLKPDSAMKIKIPMLSDKKQEEIALKVSDALRLRKEAKILLEKSKRAVEIFIEQNESEALKYLSR